VLSDSAPLTLNSAFTNSGTLDRDSNSGDGDGSPPIGGTLDNAGTVQDTSQALNAAVMVTAVATAVPTLTTLYEFCGSPNGGAPYAGLIADPASDLFGTTQQGLRCRPTRQIAVKLLIYRIF
jgi:hypothetical protein